MKNRKINVDRPHLKSEEILAGRNFDEVLANHNVMTKPFYKQHWFMGATGLASLGLIIGGTVAFQSNATEQPAVSERYLTDAPPNQVPPEANFIVSASDLNQDPKPTTTKTIELKPQKTTRIEENFTPQKNQVENVELQPDVKPEPTNTVKPETKKAADDKNAEPSTSAFLDMNPRISDKIGGTITRNELMDSRGITTEGDVSIIHFELHLIDGLGGKVFEEKGNQLNSEMKKALDDVGKGETIYFENIRGKIKNGTEIKLNPLRYVLMN